MTTQKTLETIKLSITYIHELEDETRELKYLQSRLITLIQNLSHSTSCENTSMTAGQLNGMAEAIKYVSEKILKTVCDEHDRAYP